jgi:hypothetical protein
MSTGLSASSGVKAAPDLAVPQKSALERLRELGERSKRREHQLREALQLAVQRQRDQRDQPVTVKVTKTVEVGRVAQDELRTDVEDIRHASIERRQTDMAVKSEGSDAHHQTDFKELEAQISTISTEVGHVENLQHDIEVLESIQARPARPNSAVNPSVLSNMEPISVALKNWHVGTIYNGNRVFDPGGTVLPPRYCRR